MVCLGLHQVDQGGEWAYGVCSAWKLAEMCFHGDMLCTDIARRIIDGGVFCVEIGRDVLDGAIPAHMLHGT